MPYLKTRIENGRFLLDTCYNSELEQEVRYLGGGRTENGYWVGVSKRRELEQEMILSLGEDGSGSSIKRIDVRIVGNAWNTSMEDNELSLFWRTVVWRPSYDAPVRFGPGVVPVRAKFAKKAGTLTRPELGLLNPDDAIFDVFDVPYRLFRRFSWRRGVTVPPQTNAKQVQINELLSKRRNLEREIKKIDEELANLR